MDPNQPSQQFPQAPGADQPQQQVPTPEPAQEQAPQLQTANAGFWVRYAAFQIDVALFSIVVVILQNSSLRFLTTIIFLLYTTIFTFLYGATFGKKLFRIKVVKNGSKPGLLVVILREVPGKILSFILLGIGFFWIAFDKEKQGLHDKIASTHVVLLAPLIGFRKVLVIIFRVIFILQLVLLPLGILAVGALVAINPAARQQQAKDAVRKSDIGQIATGLVIYSNKNNKFPNTLDDLVKSGDLQSVPRDPTGAKYWYLTSSDRTNAVVFAALDGDNHQAWCWRSKTGTAQLATQCTP